MGLRTRPAPGRPTVTASQAAKLLRRDVRTIRRMISDGELAGGARVVDKQRRWFVYLDQIATAAPQPAPHAPAEEVALRDQVAELRAQVATVSDTNRLLLASQSLILAAVERHQKASAEFAEIADDQRALTDRYHNVADVYRQSAQDFADALTNYRDIVAGLMAPTNIKELLDAPPDGTAR